MKYQIKHRFTDAALFECELPDDTPSGLVTRHALEKAVNSGANLVRANLYGASLYGANLAEANLDGASLDGASLDGASLAGERPIFMIGPIGSRCAYFTSYNTEKGIMLRAGCFFGTVDEFTEKLSKEHQDNDHAKEYLAALELIKCHASIWK